MFKERKRQKELAAREAAGESLWTKTLTERVRVRMWHALQTVMQQTDTYGSWKSDPYPAARAIVLAEEGLHSLANNPDPARDVANAFATGEVDLLYSLVEALIVSLRVCTDESGGNWGLDEQRAMTFTELVNAIMREERVAAEIVSGSVVTFDSREMHVTIVKPTLSLLGGKSGWSDVESAYQDALREISEDHPADAITDAGRALQQALVRVGAEGNALGPLIKSAKLKGLLAPHDGKLLDGIESLMHWVSADRSETGEAHHSGTTARDDAWLTVHVVGSLLLRLSAGARH